MTSPGLFGGAYFVFAGISFFAGADSDVRQREAAIRATGLQPRMLDIGLSFGQVSELTYELWNWRIAGVVAMVIGFFFALKQAGLPGGLGSPAVICILSAGFTAVIAKWILSSSMEVRNKIRRAAVWCSYFSWAAIAFILYLKSRHHA
jgi:hypothetical protein